MSGQFARKPVIEDAHFVATKARAEEDMRHSRWMHRVEAT